MPISARNKLRGIIEEIRRGEVMAHVVMRVGDNVIEGAITRLSADELELKAGDTVTAVVKATDVMIQKDWITPQKNDYAYPSLILLSLTSHCDEVWGRTSARTFFRIADSVSVISITPQCDDSFASRFESMVAFLRSATMQEPQATLAVVFLTGHLLHKIAAPNGDDALLSMRLILLAT
jgi:molybdopterin-binding protein